MKVTETLLQSTISANYLSEIASPEAAWVLACRARVLISSNLDEKNGSCEPFLRILSYKK
jgi:hypothetical protein